MEKTKVVVEKTSIAGTIWVIGWLFSIGFLKLSFTKGLFALLLWPYYIGQFISTFVGQP